MPANCFNGHTNFGIGLGLRIPHYPHIPEKKPVVDWFEIISENYMVDSGRPLHVLDQILEQYQVVQHGVSLYFGNASRPHREHLKKLKALTARARTPWVSDHLWLGQRGRALHPRLRWFMGSLRPAGSTSCLLPTPPRGDAVGTVFSAEPSKGTAGPAPALTPLHGRTSLGTRGWQCEPL